MVQGTLLRSLILSSLLCMALCSSDVPDAAAMAPSKDSMANTTATAAVDTPAGLSFSDSDPASSGDAMPTKQGGGGKDTTSSMAGSSTVPGVLSPDGKCTCPGVPPVPAGSPESDSPSSTGSIAPPVTPENDNTVSTNDTSASSFLKAPTNLCLIAVAAVTGINALAA